MNKITSVTLENEMDLILAHKQSMRIAELAGLSLPAQTTFATAVSEISRNAFGQQNNASLSLYVSDKAERIKYIIAVLEDERRNFLQKKDEGFLYAKKLVSNIEVVSIGGKNKITLGYRLPMGFRIDDILIEKWSINLNTDPVVSPYEEIKRKNRQLVEMADKVRESEEQYRSLTNSLPIMIFTMDNEHQITYANQWLKDYTGQNINKINTTRWQDILHGDDVAGLWDTWEQKKDDSTLIASEHRIKNAENDEYRWHKIVSIAITADDGAPQYWNNFMVDIHAQKMIEEALKDNMDLRAVQTELKEKIELLNQSNQQLEQFAFVASHDLQEPLRKISLYSDLLQKKFSINIPEDAGVFFDNLISATARMKMLIQDILAYSTVRREGFTVVNLNDVANETIHSIEIGIQEKSAEINVGHLPQVEGNKRQLLQLFENIVSNAIKYSRPGVPPVVSIQAEVQGNQVLLTFTDNGIGFEEHYMQKMFEIFQRLHTRDKYAGTGIGLAICKKIVDLHNGTIAAAGTPDIGATFLVTLPLTQPIV